MSWGDDKRKEAEDRRFAEAKDLLAREETLQSRREELESRRAALEVRRAASSARSRGVEVAERPEDARWSAVTALVVSAAVTVVVLATLVGLLILLDRTTSGPESALSLVFVAAAVVLILVVCTLTIVLKRLRLSNADEAMGLPRGSIRAVIALMLILLFFIAAIFLFNTTRDVRDPDKTREVNGLSQANFDSISPDLIVESSRQEVEGEVTYDVTLYEVSQSTPTSDDLAKQLVTVLGTLVTAVAAFYFGANSVNDVRARQGGPTAPVVLPPAPPSGPDSLEPSPPTPETGQVPAGEETPPISGPSGVSAPMTKPAPRTENAPLAGDPQNQGGDGPGRDDGPAAESADVTTEGTHPVSASDEAVRADESEEK